MFTLLIRATFLKTSRSSRKNVTQILREGRQRGVRRFFVAGDLNIELGLLCTGDEEDEELIDMKDHSAGMKRKKVDRGGSHATTSKMKILRGK